MNYKKPKWAVKQIVRASGLVEDICKHGVGHPNIEWLQANDFHGDHGFAIHGCDSCCSMEDKNVKIKDKKGRDRKTA